MRSAPPTYIWRKTATASWLVGHELRLHELTSGAYAVIDRPGRQRSIIERFCATRSAAETLRAELGGAIVRLPRDWEARALAASSTKLLRVGRRLTIASDAVHLPRDSTSGATLIIPAGAAFGTGEHATTAMSLRMLERITRRLDAGWRMLDVGTGSGILALAASRFGAGDVIAIDNDPVAISTAKANARSNGVRGVRFAVGDAKQTPCGTFDVIAANLYSELLVAVLPSWRRSLAADGRLVLSGVMRTQERTVTRALHTNGFHAVEIRRRGKWIALLARAKT